jgi:hypothetical protein
MPYFSLPLILHVRVREFKETWRNVDNTTGTTGNRAQAVTDKIWVDANQVQKPVYQVQKACLQGEL